MSAIIETFLKCDGPAGALPPAGCEDTWGVDDRGQHRGPAIAEHRFYAKEAGWKQRGSKDYCPSCWAALQVRKA